MLVEKTLLGLRGRKLQGELLIFALEAEDDELQASARAAENGLASKTLVKQGPMRITLITLRKGAALQSHQVEGPSSIQILRGRLKIEMESGDVEIASGHLVTLAAAVIHKAIALQDCAMLLTIIKP